MLLKARWVKEATSKYILKNSFAVSSDFHQNKIDVHFDDINLDDVMRSESKFVLALNRVEG